MPRGRARRREREDHVRVHDVRGTHPDRPLCKRTTPLTNPRPTLRPGRTTLLVPTIAFREHQEIRVNYTIATGSAPDVKVASANCHNSHVLLRNYELDQVGQAEVDALAQARADISMYENLIAFTKNLINSQAMVTTDDQGIATLIQHPPPPPPPPPVQAGSAPAPPETVSGATLVRRYEDALLETEARADELVLKLADCFAKDRTSGVVCGLSSNEAPYPWSAVGNGKCRGYDTLSTREGDYCGYCEPVAIQTNPRGPCSRVPFLVARRGERRQPAGGRQQAAQGAAVGGPLLLRRRRQSAVLLAQRLTHAAQRRHRRRLHETARPRILARLLRLKPHTRTHMHTCTRTCAHAAPDQPCSLALRSEFKFARQRLTAEAGDDIELCRANLTARLERCDLNCDACGAQCTSKAATDAMAVFRCSLLLPVLGMLQAQHSSDLGLVRKHPTQTF